MNTTTKAETVERVTIKHPAPEGALPTYAGHTPGPWVIGRSADNTPLIMVPTPISEGSGFGVAHINRLPRMGSVRGDMDANARLIAAAPDLLAERDRLRASEAELVAALQDISESDDTDNALDPARNKRVAAAALAKHQGA